MWGIFHRKPSVPQNTVMDMNNVMDIVHQGLLYLEFDSPTTRD
jgi:hypothetical protein